MEEMVWNGFIVNLAKISEPKIAALSFLPKWNLFFSILYQIYLFYLEKFWTEKKISLSNI